jgi:hypothetical protein
LHDIGARAQRAQNNDADQGRGKFVGHEFHPTGPMLAKRARQM